MGVLTRKKLWVNWHADRAHFASIPQLLCHRFTHLLLQQHEGFFFFSHRNGQESFRGPRQLAGTDDSLISFCFHPPQNTVSLSELQSPDPKACPLIGGSRWAMRQLTGSQASDWTRVSQNTSSRSRAESVQKSHEGRKLWNNTLPCSDQRKVCRPHIFRFIASLDGPTVIKNPQGWGKSCKSRNNRWLSFSAQPKFLGSNPPNVVS